MREKIYTYVLDSKDTPLKHVTHWRPSMKNPTVPDSELWSSDDKPTTSVPDLTLIKSFDEPLFDNASINTAILRTSKAVYNEGEFLIRRRFCAPGIHIMQDHQLTLHSSHPSHQSLLRYQHHQHRHSALTIRSHPSAARQRSLARQTPRHHPRFQWHRRPGAAALPSQPKTPRPRQLLPPSASHVSQITDHHHLH